MAVLPTGSGKTGITVLSAYCCGKNKQVLVVTPSEIISRQQYNDFFTDSERPTFLEDRGLFSRAARSNYMPNGKLITKTHQLQPAFESMELIVVNAHKLGTRSNVRLEDIPVKRDVLVIVDEAHHYPAVTWKNIVAHFKGCRIIFLTATPYNKGKYILGNERPCYELSRADAIERGIIRDACFIEVPEEATTNEHLETLLKEYFNSVPTNERDFKRAIEILHVLSRMKKALDEHDAMDKDHKHQGMVLAADIEEAKTIAKLWNTVIGGQDECETFVSKDHPEAREEFEAGNLRMMVVIYRLIEGFDRKNVSVVGILRNVQPKSRVYFAQFVGRAVRKLHPTDPVEATIISHKVHNQKINYETFEELAEEDPEEPEEN
jgi:superfamily II DNA or RNA helicase